jgi:hypothetical protein
MTQDLPITHRLIAHSGEDNCGADQHIRPLCTFMSEAQK